MISAMTPPIMKKMNELIRYRYPIVLWSVVVIHLTRMLPLRSTDGVPKAARSAWGAGAVAVLISLPVAVVRVSAVARQVGVRVVLRAELALVARVAQQRLDLGVVLLLRRRPSP